MKYQKGMFMPASVKSPVEPSEGYDWSDTRKVLKRSCPALFTHVATCPACAAIPWRERTFGQHCAANQPDELIEIVMHLNDTHKWPRCLTDYGYDESYTGLPNIADWLDEVAVRDGVDLSFRDPEEVAKDPPEASWSVADEMFADYTTNPVSMYLNPYLDPKTIFSTDTPNQKMYIGVTFEPVTQDTYKPQPGCLCQTCKAHFEEKE